MTFPADETHDSPTENENSQTALPTEEIPDVLEHSETVTDLPIEELVGKWVVVNYENTLYPGIVEDQDENGAVKVNAMSCIGNNRFYWPRQRDEIWYDSIVSIIPEPKNVTKRHKQVDPHLWRQLQSRFE